MLHENPGIIPANKSEASPEGRKRLAEFIKKVEKSRIRKTWKTPDGLKLSVREALDHAKATKPAVGWVRGDAITSMEALEELNEVRKENARFRDEIGSLEIELALPPIPAADDEITIDLLPNTNRKGYESAYGSTATIKTTWIAAFPVFFNNLKWNTIDWNNEYSYYIDADESCIQIGSAIAGIAESLDPLMAFKINKSTLDRLMSYYIEAGLMNATEAEKAFTEMAQRVARRHSIAGGHEPAFRVTSGKISVTSPSTVREDYSDEIPF